MIGEGQADFVRIFNKLYDSVKDGLNMSQIPNWLSYKRRVLV